MDKPHQYQAVIKFIIKKLKKIDGFTHKEVSFGFDEIRGSNNIREIDDLKELLDNFKQDKVYWDGERKTVIDDYKIENETITLLEVETGRLENYCKMIMGKKNDNTITNVPFELNPKRQWRDITIRFTDGHNVEVAFNDDWANAKKMNFVDFGCLNKKNTNPDVQWQLLLDLANSNGAIAWDSNSADKNIPKKKQKLTKRLKEIFVIDKDPFESYRKNQAYVLKIKLIPEGRSRRGLLPFNPNIDDHIHVEVENIHRVLGNCYDPYENVDDNNDLSV